VSKATQTVKTVVFVLISVFIVTLLYSMIFRVDFFNTGTSYYLEFDSIGTIVTGSPVRKSGVKVGSVIEVKINPITQRTVLLLIRLFPGNIIRTSDQISIVTGGLLGDQFIDVFPGDPLAASYQELSVIPGKPSFDLASIASSGEDVLKEVSRTTILLGNLVEQNQESIARTVQNIETLTQGLSRIGETAATLDRTAVTLEREIVRISNNLNTSITTLVDQAQKSLAALESVGGAAKEIETAGRTLNRQDSVVSLMGNPQTARSIESILTDLKEISGNLNQITKDIRDQLAE